MIKFIDLFAGVGGIRIGAASALEKFGIQSKCVLSSEIDEKACETYQLNFGEYPSGDIKKIVDIEPFDLLLAGSLANPFPMLVREKDLAIHEAHYFLKSSGFLVYISQKHFY